jgi:hypothetical protein
LQSRLLRRDIDIGQVGIAGGDGACRDNELIAAGNQRAAAPHLFRNDQGIARHARDIGFGAADMVSRSLHLDHRGSTDRPRRNAAMEFRALAGVEFNRNPGRNLAALLPPAREAFLCRQFIRRPGIHPVFPLRSPLLAPPMTMKNRQVEKTATGLERLIHRDA